MPRSAGRTSPGASRTSGALARASLTGPAGLLTFQFNPLKVSMTKKASTEGGRGLITNSFEDAVKAIGNLTISLSEIHFTGPTTKANCDKLISWTTPTPAIGAGGGRGARAPSAGGSRGATGIGGGVQAASTTRSPTVVGSFTPGAVYKLPVLAFSWGGGGGRGLAYKVVIEKVAISFERFGPDGIPLWAKVSIDLKEYAEEMPSTNPTSGGPAGRTKHVVTAGESVVRIANLSYGTPDAWRVVAEANRLDDPLRVKPGKLLDLPGATELNLGVSS